MDRETIGQLRELCQQVYRGSKPCAMIPVKKKYIGPAKAICIMENCKFRFNDLSEEWLTLWVYIRDELMDVVDCLPEKPESAADHYLFGALFGYSNDAICDYISTTPEEKS